MAEPADRRPPAHTRLTIRYVFALSTVALLSLCAQLLVQHQLTLGEADSRVINIAGRQRMLSQRLAKASLLIANDSTAQPAKVSTEVAQTCELWTRSHQALQQGGGFDLPGENSRQVQLLFEKIAPHYQAMADAASQLQQDTPTEKLSELVATIQQHEAPFLSGMDAIVSQYVLEAEAKVSRLRTLELALLVLTLAVLLAEGLWIFRPAVRRIRQSSDHLRKARDEAEQASRSKSRFLANVSHELRTPMTAVLGATDLALASPTPASKDQHLSTIEEAGSLLLALLNELIDFAQSEAGRLELNQQTFQPGQLAEQVVRMLQASADNNPVELHCESKGATNLTLLGDPQRLKQVLLNLVSNGLKWTDQGSVTLRTQIAHSGANQAVLKFDVIDTGCGIAPEDLAKIFDPFEQGRQHRKRGGVGLGLAICKRIAEAMSGELRLDSQPGQGTTASLELLLPIAEEAHDSPPLAPIATPQNPLRVLVLEDTPLNQRVLNAALQQAGHAVDIFPSGEQAVEAFQHHPYDVVITDINLPGMSGLEAARQMQHHLSGSHRSNVRFIALSADAANPANASRYDVVLPKPFRTHQLLASLYPRTATNAASTMPNHQQETQPSLLDELAMAYLEIGPPTRAQLQHCLETADWQQAQRLAHRLKGQVVYFHRATLASDLRTIELACKQGVVDVDQLPLQETIDALSQLEADLAAQVQAK